MSEAFTDTTENRLTEAADHGATTGRHRSAVAWNEQAEKDGTAVQAAQTAGHGRHRRTDF